MKKQNLHKNWRQIGFPAACLVLFLAAFGISAANAATLTVTKTADTNDGVCDADCSLREAIAAANASASNDSITFAIPPTDAGCVGGVCTIALGGTQLTINNAANAGSLTIQNPNGTAANLRVSGNNASRVFNVVSGANLTLNNLTVTGGRLTGSTNLGGGIFTIGGTVTLMNCTVSNNVLCGGTNSVSGGGGIFSFFGTLNIIGSTISNNSATGTIAGGGGIYAEESTFNITGSTVSNNSASGGSNENSGGGIYIRNLVLNLTNSTVSGNSVAGSGRKQGGGIYILDSLCTLNLTNSTISNNSAIGGSSTGAGGIHADSNSTTNARNTIISGNSSVTSPDFNNLLSVNDNNLIGNAAQVRLAPLGFYGGATMTHALLSGSTAINTGNNCVLTQTCTGFNAPIAFTADQRGAARFGAADIGAFELNNSANGGNFVAVLPTGEQGTAYSRQITANNGAFTYAVTSGILPNGVNLTTDPAPNAVVSISGTPTQTGTFNFSITASDGANSNITDYALEILPPPVSDSTPPVITPTVTGTLGSNDWYVSNVQISWSVTDAESSVSNQSGCETQSVTADTSGVTFTCSAQSAGGSDSQSVTIKRDTTAPTIAFDSRTAPNSNGWNNTNVQVNWNCADTLSGASSASVNQILIAEGANQSATGTCFDVAGNFASNTQTGIKIDKTAPTLSPAVSPNPVLLNGSATASPNASDALSGIASASCGAVNTSTVGNNSVNCTATDLAGNTTTASANYRVIYNFAGFFQPVDNLPTVNVVTAGQAVPIKFSLNGNQGLAIFAAGYPASSAIACNASEPGSNIEETVNAGGSILTYNAAADQYSYVWKTDRAWKGTCRLLVIKFNDGNERLAKFRFR